MIKFTVKAHRFNAGGEASRRRMTRDKCWSASGSELSQQIAVVRPARRVRRRSSSGGAGVFYYFYDDAGARGHGRARRRSSPRCAPTSQGPGDGATSCPSSEAQVGASSKRGSKSLQAVLPEEKDVADLLRRMQTLATQSNLTIRGFKPAPSVTKKMHAEWPISSQLDGTYHNLGLFFDRVSKFPRIINVSNCDQGEGQAASPTRRSPPSAWRRRSC